MFMLIATMICTCFTVGRLQLNRQVIVLMSGLGVPDKAFFALQDDMLQRLADMLIRESSAVDALAQVKSWHSWLVLSFININFMFLLYYRFTSFNLQDKEVSIMQTVSAVFTNVFLILLCLPCAYLACMALSWGQPTWQGIGFSGLVHEETHPCWSNFVQSIFEAVQAGCINSIDKYFWGSTNMMCKMTLLTSESLTWYMLPCHRYYCL